MPKDYTKKSAFEHFGTKQKNIYKSWSAISEDMGTVAVTIWKDQLKYKDGKPYWDTFSLPENQSNNFWKDAIGNKERIEHLKHCRNKLDGLFRVVITVAVDVDANPREILEVYPFEGIWMKLQELNEETGECYAEFHSKD